jgi:hypothetical protein
MGQPDPSPAPASWIEALAESEADIEAGRIVSGKDVMRDLHDGLAGLEAQLATGKRKGPSRA